MAILHNTDWEYYVNGTERECRITPMDASPTISAQEAHFYLYDHLGNTRITYTPLDVNGNNTRFLINAVVDYFPYGKVLREYNLNEKERFLTTQHERDQETGLDYRGARYYDSDIARFLSTDPWQNKYPAWSTYNYTMGNPIIFIDPSGRSPENPDGTDDPRENEHKKTGWTENHAYLNEVFGDPNGFNEIITSISDEGDKKKNR